MHTLKKFIQYYAPYKKVFDLCRCDQSGWSGFSTDFTNIDEDIIYREFWCDFVGIASDYTRVAYYVYDPDWMQVLC